MLHSKSPGRLLQIHILMFLPVFFIQAQEGTYELKNKNGSYGLISIINKQNKITAEVFTWCNTPSAQTGSFYSQGENNNNHVILKNIQNDSDCLVGIKLMNLYITVTFNKCTADHLTDDFNGTYRKVSDATAGDYIVKADRTFFYSKPDEHSKRKSYLVKGNRASYNLDGGAIGKWVFVDFRNRNGTDTSGYIKLSDLKKL